MCYTDINNISDSGGSITFRPTTFRLQTVSHESTFVKFLFSTVNFNSPENLAFIGNFFFLTASAIEKKVIMRDRPFGGRKVLGRNVEAPYSGCKEDHHGTCKRRKNFV